MRARLNREKSELMTKVLSNPECMWEKDTADTMAKYDITPDHLVGTKGQTKGLIKKAVLSKLKPTFELACQGKSKMTYFLEGRQCWTPGKTAKYMNELTRKQTSTIFKTRCRMIKVKGNYKNGHTDLTCRLCKAEDETQTHVLEECPALHPTDALKVSKHQLFSEDTGTLNKTVEALDAIMEKIENVC